MKHDIIRNKIKIWIQFSRFKFDKPSHCVKDIEIMVQTIAQKTQTWTSKIKFLIYSELHHVQNCIILPYTIVVSPGILSISDVCQHNLFSSCVSEKNLRSSTTCKRRTKFWLEAMKGGWDRLGDKRNVFINRNICNLRIYFTKFRK